MSDGDPARKYRPAARENSRWLAPGLPDRKPRPASSITKINDPDLSALFDMPPVAKIGGKTRLAAMRNPSVPDGWHAAWNYGRATRRSRCYREPLPTISCTDPDV
jgi:hypothetical protein